MTIKRRSFIKKSALGTALAGSGLWACSNGADTTAETSLAAVNPNSKKSIPAVIATWDNQEATEAAAAVLQTGGSALDAVETGARVPEADPKDNSVGYGGLPDRTGVVTLDACIMDHQGNAGAVTFLQNIKHPISVARKVMEVTPHVMLSGAGALEFAKEQGFEEENLLTEEAEKMWRQWQVEKKPYGEVNFENHDTIGLLALDQSGNISGACTTSGLAFKYHGRVGDSPIIGAGMYVDNEVGGACATGVGEYVMKTLGSFLIVELMRQGRGPQEACEEAIERIVRKHPKLYREYEVGYLAINKDGQHGAYGTEKGFEYTLFQDGVHKLHPADHYLKS